MDEFMRFVTDGGTSDTDPVAARMSVAAGVPATRSLREGGTPYDLPPLDEEARRVLRTGQPRSGEQPARSRLPRSARSQHGPCASAKGAGRILVGGALRGADVPRTAPAAETAAGQQRDGGEVVHMGRGRWWLVAVVAALLVWGVMHVGGQHAGDPRTAAGDASGASPSAFPSASPSATSIDWSNYAPARFAPQVRSYAREAGIDPQLLMAILYNEDYKPHDPAFERAWLQANPDAALGIANMHRATFDQTKQGRPFADRQWTDLPGNPALAVESAAWYLHDLGADLPGRTAPPLTRDDLMALGYNTGPGNMLSFARGVPLGPSAQGYLDRLRFNWSTAGAAVRG